MRGAMDVFLFPSLYEGLGLVLVEAQAAGLPCVIADVVPEEADLVHGLVRRLPLEAAVTAWADAVVAARRSDPGAALAAVERSPYTAQASVRGLEEVYLG